MSIYLPLTLAIMGFLFTIKEFLIWFNQRNPATGLLVYYAILLGAIFTLEYFGLVVAGIKFDSARHTIGTILIIFSFFIVVNWESCYINQVTKGNCDQVSNIYLSSEDGATYYLWSKVTKDRETARILTYVVTPFVLSFIGMSLITQKVTLSPF